MLNTSGVHTADILLPQNIRNLSGYTQTDVTFSMPGLVQRTLNVFLYAETNVVFINAPGDLLPRLTTGQMGITFRGPRETAQEVTSENFRFIIDLAGADGGTATFLADVYIEGFPGVEVTGGQPHPVSVRFAALAEQDGQMDGY
jgi:hypothetical protein